MYYVPTSCFRILESYFNILILNKVLPYLENLHFPSPPGSSGGSPLDEGGGMVIKTENIHIWECQSFAADRHWAPVETEERGEGEGGGGEGGGGGGAGEQTDAVGQEEVQDHLLLKTEKWLQDPVIFVTLHSFWDQYLDIFIVVGA